MIVTEPGRLDILFSSNHNIHKCSYGLCFLASDTLMEGFSIKGSKAQNYKGLTNFYECCDLMNKVYLVLGTIYTGPACC